MAKIVITDLIERETVLPPDLTIDCQVTPTAQPDLQPGLNNEPQNIEYRTAELRRMVSLCSFS
jgi:hypothetical protein